MTRIPLLTEHQDPALRCTGCGGPISSRRYRRYCSLPCYRSRPAFASVAERFWAKVDVRGPDECWEWMGVRDAFGYGRMASGSRGAQRRRRAHVISLELAGRPLPAGLITRHTCDNPPCVNPAHLLPGTHAENMHDMAVRGRRKGRR